MDVAIIGLLIAGVFVGAFAYLWTICRRSGWESDPDLGEDLEDDLPKIRGGSIAGPTWEMDAVTQEMVLQDHEWMDD